MPLLALLLVASVAGSLAALVARSTAAGAGRRATRPARTPALAVVLAGGLVLGALTLLVSSSGGDLGIDRSFAAWAHRHATGWSTHGLKVVTAFGATWTAALVGVLVAAVEVARTRRGRVVAFLLVVVLGDKLLTTVVKHLVGRARPGLDPAAAALGPSFPSGHASTSAALWAAVALVAAGWVAPRRRPALAALAVGLPVGVAASRVLLDVHWLTDVLGGLALGWAWLALCVVAFGGRGSVLGARAGARAEATGPRTQAA